MFLNIYPMTSLNWIFLKHETLDTEVEWVAHLLCKRQISPSNPDANICYPDRRISLLQSLQINCPV